MMIARAATSTDLPELSRLWYEKMVLQQQSDHHLVLMPEAQSKWASTAVNWLANNRCSILVVEGESELLGYIIGWLQDAPTGFLPEEIGVVTDLMIDAHTHKSGVGRILLQSLRGWFIAQGIQQMVAHVPARLAVEQAFWQAQGTTEWMNIVWLR